MFLLKILLNILSQGKCLSINVRKDFVNFPLSVFSIAFANTYQIVDFCCIHSFLGRLCMEGMLH